MTGVFDWDERLWLKKGEAFLEKMRERFSDMQFVALFGAEDGFARDVSEG